jgi:hypothetical protein
MMPTNDDHRTDDGLRKDHEEVEQNRRSFLKGSAAVAGAGLAAATAPGRSAAQANSESQNPFGRPRPGGGIWYRPAFEGETVIYIVEEIETGAETEV